MGRMKIQSGILLVLTLCITCCNGKRILLLPPPFTSQMMEIAGIGEALIDQGHEVYMAVTEAYPLMDLFDKKRIKLITSKVKYPDLLTMKQEDNIAFTQEMMDENDMMYSWRKNVPEWNNVCRNPLEDDEFYDKLKELHFDMAIVDIFPNSRCFLALTYSLGVPYAGLITSYEHWFSRTPALPSVSPFNLMSVGFSDRMSFPERLWNTWKQLSWALTPGFEVMEDDFVKKYIREKQPVGFDELMSKCLLFFIDGDPLLDYPKPTMPNEFYVGGLTTGPSSQLPQELATFMDSSNDPVILITFGSFLVVMEDHLLREFLMALNNIKYRIVWKYSEEVEGLPKTVKRLPWVPQNDVLGHPNTKLFLTHCGNNGQMESLYHGVPMIGFPLFGDQPHNCHRLKAHGFGICLNRQKFKGQDLVDAVNEVMTNSSYEKNIKFASKLFRERKMSPQETAAYWVDHVMKYGGDHMRSYALDMPWYQYLMLDIISFVFCVGSMIVLFFVCLVLYIWRKIFAKKDHQKTA